MNKEKSKLYSDRKRGAKESGIEVGDTVLVKATRTNKLSPNFSSDEFSVINKKGSELQLQSKSDGRMLKRNSSHAVKLINYPFNSNNESESSDVNNEANHTERCEKDVGSDPVDPERNCIENNQVGRHNISGTDSDQIEGNNYVNIDTCLQLNRNETMNQSLSSITPPRPKRKRILPHKLNDFILDENEP